MMTNMIGEEIYEFTRKRDSILEKAVRGELRGGVLREVGRLCRDFVARVYYQAYGEYERSRYATDSAGGQGPNGQTLEWRPTRGGDDDLRQVLAMEDTQPLPVIERTKFTLSSLRIACGLSHMQVAQASGVRLCRVVWIEQGIESSSRDVGLVLLVYSRKLGFRFRLDDVTGVKVRER